jgi:hypothetical protein
MSPLARFIITAAALMGLFVATGSFAPPANADCPHKGNPDHKHCSNGGGGGSGGGGKESDPSYEVAFIAGEVMCVTPLFNPGDLAAPIVATTVERKGRGVGYSAKYPRHLTDGGPTLTMNTGAQLADDVTIIVGTNELGQIVSVQIKGQPEIGQEALAHESEVVQLMQTVDPLVDEPFTVHVDTDFIPVWQLSKHLGGKRVEIVGQFCLGDMLYTPQS